MPKVKDKVRILKLAREKQLVTYKGAPIRLSADFSKETLQPRRGWQEILKVMKSRDLQPRLLYPAKLSFSIEGQIKNNLHGINIRMDEAKNQVSNLEYKETKNNQSEQQEEKKNPE